MHPSTEILVSVGTDDRVNVNAGKGKEVSTSINGSERSVLWRRASTGVQKCSLLATKCKDLEASFPRYPRGKPHYCPDLLVSSPVIFSLSHQLHDMI